MNRRPCAAHRGMTAAFCFFLVLSFSLSGCEPLRKKFIRKKKKEKEETAETIPILEPVDYPEKIHTVDDLYLDHYSLWQTWQKELLISLEESRNSKRQLNNIDQAMLQLGEMQKLLLPESQEPLKNIIEKLRAVREELSTPVPLHNTVEMKLELHSLEREIRENFKPRQVQAHLIQEIPQGEDALEGLSN